MSGERWEHPFLEQRPYVRPSLNQARIVDLPGVDLPHYVRNRQGYDLLGAHTLQQRIERAFPELRQAKELFRAFDDYLAPGNARLNQAQAIAAEYGRALGYLLLMLKRADPVNRAVRPEWRAAHWAHWQRIQRVFVGGGLVAARLGETAVAAAAALLVSHGFSKLRLARSVWPAFLPLLGAARTAPYQTETMLVFDFGQTSLKRAFARYEDGHLVALHQLPSWPAACGTINLRRDPALAQETADHLLRCVADTWRAARAAGECPGATIAASVACYLLEGHPALPWDMGCYGRLQLLTDSLTTYLADRLSLQLDRPIILKLYHDGTAAAMTYAGTAKTAVLTLGTAIGNGFPPPATGLRPVSPIFSAAS